MARVELESTTEVPFAFIPTREVKQPVAERSVSFREIWCELDGTFEVGECLLRVTVVRFEETKIDSSDNEVRVEHKRCSKSTLGSRSILVSHLGEAEIQPELRVRSIQRNGFLEGRDQLDGFQALKIVLDPSRDELSEKIDNRAGQMFDIGLVAEVSNLLDRGFPSHCKPFESLGYSQTISLLQGRLSLEEARDSTCLETRRYAKRQRTWFRKEPEAEWVNGFGDDPSTQATARSLVAGFLGSTHELFRRE